MITMPPHITTWIEPRHEAVLITTRRDGSPQSCNVVYAMRDGVARVSVTADRAKTRNLRRSPRGVLHVLGDSFWQYAAFSVDAALSPVTTTAGDLTGLELLEVYEAITGAPHPDPSEFFAAMIQEQRLVLHLSPVSAVGMGVDG